MTIAANMRDELHLIMAGAGGLARAHSITNVIEKATFDYVTNVDHAIDAWLTEHLRKIAPDAPVFSEERSMEGWEKPERCWLIDPLDGTHNFKAGLAISAVSVALFSGEDVVLAGVCDIASGEVYVAQRGAGSWLNGRRLFIPETHCGLIAISSGTMDTLVGEAEAYGRLRKFGKIRNFGAQALHLCYVARGRFALAASQEARVWDDAAGRLIVEEAGGQYLSFGPPGRTATSASTPTASVSGHPEVFDHAVPLFAQVWGARDVEIRSVRLR